MEIKDRMTFAEFLANRIFSIGNENETGSPTSRIEFKSWQKDGIEVAQGGLGFESLTRVISQAIDDWKTK